MTKTIKKTLIQEKISKFKEFENYFKTKTSYNDIFTKLTDDEFKLFYNIVAGITLSNLIEE